MYQYVHGGDIYEKSAPKNDKTLLDYSANINPLGIPAGVRKALQQAAGDCCNYPDPFCRALRTKLASFLQVPAEWIYCGNGAADVLFRLMQALKPGRTLLLAPTFADYEKAALSVGSKVDYFLLEEAQGFAVTPEILRAVTKRTRMVILCNPNNPTGRLMPRELLLQVLECCRALQIPLLLDECFLDFLPDDEAHSLLDCLQDYPNLIILKAFTKIYAIPGVRLGYCLTSNPRLVEQLYENGQDWNVSVPAQAAGIAALEEGPSYLAETRFLITAERAYMAVQLRLVGFKVYEGTANYLFLKSERVIDWVGKLKERGILIRDCANYRGLGPGYYRVAIRTRRENRRLIKCMKEIVKNALLNGIN